VKHLIALAALALGSAGAGACPLTDLLTERYGISFSGFEKAIPASAEPKVAPDRAYVRVLLRDKAPVSDGYRHAVLLDVAGRQAWILRTGGFVPVYQWYGPVDVGDVSAADCRNELPAGLRFEPRTARPAGAAQAQAVGGT